MKIDRSHIDDVEHGIAPPMNKAITLPTDKKGIVIYITIGAFHQGSRPTDAELIKTAVEIADRLEAEHG